MEKDRRVAEATDRDLLLRHTCGDREAFGRLYDRYGEALLFYAHSFLGDAALAEDLLQESFLRLLDQDPQGLQESVRGLLYTILRNLARDEARKRSTRLKSYPFLVPAERAAETPPDDLSRALHALPSEQCEAIILKIYSGHTFAEIAELTGESEPTVKSRYRYGLEKLALLLSEERRTP